MNKSILCKNDCPEGVDILQKRYETEKDKAKKVEWKEVRKPYAKFATCPMCGGDENLYGEDSVKNDFCGRCGQRLEW